MLRALAVGFVIAILCYLVPTPTRHIHKQVDRATSVKATNAVTKPIAPPKGDQPQPEKNEKPAETSDAGSTPQSEPPVETPLTTHEQLMQAAGISPADYGAADYIISHESSWNVEATEPNTGAHGLVQALPYSKTGCGWSDAVCQLKWATSYAAKYGGWQGAYAFWQANAWW